MGDILHTMNGLERRQRANRVLAGYTSGPGATRRARDTALSLAREARVVVLVEGISDLIALAAIAERRGRDLDSEGTVVVPAGGAQGFQQLIEQFRERGVVVRCLVDQAEEVAVRRAPGDSGGLDLFVCVEDLEDELIRAVGPDKVVTIIDREGDLKSFRSLQKQPAWRDGELTPQLRRFLGAGARRKLRYARLLALELEPHQVPRPLEQVLKTD